MGDGWETRRRREPGKDWIIIKLATKGLIKKIEIDTAHFKGNYPDQASVQGANLDQNKSLEEIINTFQKRGYAVKDIEKAMNEIKSCDLSPGLNYENTNYIIPDLKIELKEKSLSINFINDTFPKIKIDHDLIEKTNAQLKNNPNKELADKIQDAKWLLSSIKKRNDTVMQVGELICKRQISFLQDNPLKINPLSNKSLSDELGLHPSTVSRILRSKYIDTPKGIIPLKSLLVSSVSKTRDVTF